MNSFWQEFFKYIGSVAIISAIGAFLIRSLIVHFLSKDIESYKAKLKAQTDAEIAMFSSKLTIAAKENEIRFGKLHEKRVESIAKLYELIEDADASSFLLSIMLNDALEIKDVESFAHDALSRWADVSRFWKANKLYFPRDLSDQLDTVIKRIGGVTDTFILASDSPSIPIDVVKKAVEMKAQEGADITKVLEIIEKRFREMLGDNDAASNNAMQPTAR